MGSMSFPSQIIVYKDSQELCCVYLFNIFITILLNLALVYLYSYLFLTLV